METTKRRTARVRRASGFGRALAPRERQQWEARLGWQTEDFTKWGRLVSEYLFKRPAAQRRALLAHAFEVFPLVVSTAEDRFEAGTTSQKTDIAVALAHREPFAALVRSLEHRGSSAAVAAREVDRYLTRVTAEERCVLVGALFHKLDFCPIATNRCPYRTDQSRSTEPSNEIANRMADVDVLVRARDRVIPILAIADHLSCGSDRSTGVREILDRIAELKDPRLGAVVFHAVVERLVHRIARRILSSLHGQAIVVPLDELLAGLSSRGAPSSDDDSGDDAGGDVLPRGVTSLFGKKGKLPQA